MNGLPRESTQARSAEPSSRASFVSDDLSECQIKDLDELEFTVRVGMFRPVEALSIRAAAETAIADVAERRWPFDETAWNQVRPRHLLTPTTLPPGWDAP